MRERRFSASVGNRTSLPRLSRQLSDHCYEPICADTCYPQLGRNVCGLNTGHNYCSKSRKFWESLGTRAFLEPNVHFAKAYQYIIYSQTLYISRKRIRLVLVSDVLRWGGTETLSATAIQIHRTLTCSARSPWYEFTLPGRHE